MRLIERERWRAHFVQVGLRGYWPPPVIGVDGEHDCA